MAKKEDILIINDWQKGMGQSAHTGFYVIKNCNVDEDGVIRPNFKLTQVTDVSGGDEIDGSVVGMAIDPSDNSKIYALAMTGASGAKLFRSTDSGANWTYLSAVTLTTNIAPKGLIIYKGYLALLGATKIDWIKLSDLSTDLDWETPAFGTTGDSSFHPSIVGPDDILYIGNGRYIASVSEKLGQTFDPGNSATYTWNNQALDLPSTARVRTIDWLNNRLIIGTWNGSSILEAKIYKWDTYSPSFESPVELNEIGVRAGITVGNTYYFFVGGGCDLYATDGNNSAFISHLPREILGLISTTGNLDINPNAIMHKGNKIYFGLKSGANTTGNLRGVWSYNLLNGAFLYENEISTGNDGTVDFLSIDFLFSIGNIFFTAWFDANTGAYGIDILDSNKYPSYKAVIESPLYKLGTKTNKETISNLEAQFARVFSSDAFRVSYRRNLSSSYTVITNLITTTDGTVSLEDGTPLIDLENCQLKIEMSNNTSLIEIRLK